VPADFVRALKSQPKAAAAFKALSTSLRNEYVEWVSGAKQPATRARRFATALKWLSEGKNYNWKYERRA
jgi:uncharacterized protein YdeI (YjbR/CyaY-like superfamily)